MKKHNKSAADYVMNELSQSDREAFERAMEGDAALQDEVAGLKDLSQDLSQHLKAGPKLRLNDLKLAQIKKQTKASGSGFTIRKEYYAVAAVFVAAVGAVLFQQKNADSDSDAIWSVVKTPEKSELAQEQRQPADESPYKIQDQQIAEQAPPAPQKSPESQQPQVQEVSRPSGVNLGGLGLGVGKVLNKSGSGAIKSDFKDSSKMAGPSSGALAGGAGGLGGAGLGSGFGRSPGMARGMRQGLGGPGSGKTLGVAGAGAASNNFSGGFGGSGRNDSSGETYAIVKENGFIPTKTDSRSTFSVDVDKASYSNVRRFINQGQRPPVDAIRIEEMINYFPYEYEAPKANVPFAATMNVFSAPWNPEHRLVRIGIKGQEMKWNHRPALNLVFLVDVSGSMASEGKLALVQNSLKLVVEQMSAMDRIALVTYASGSGVALAPTLGSNKAEIVSAIERMQAGGGTNGAGGIELAYKLAQDNFVKGAVNRVVLATDGDFNLGPYGEGDLTRLIQDKASKGVQLTVLGYGMGNTNDKTMELLAREGNGNYAYIDSILEANKALVKEIGGTMITIAQDVKLQVEFNPKHVKSYRLIGYENRMLAHQDFNDDKKDAGDIGAGHTVTAFYEIVPVGKGSEGIVDDLKYIKKVVSGDADDELLTLKLRYKQPGGKDSKLISQVLKDDGKKFENAGKDFKFAAAVAMFGMELRNSEHKGKSSFSEALSLAKANAGDDDYRRDFVKLVQKATTGLAQNSSPYTADYQQKANVQMAEGSVEGGLTHQVVQTVIRANLNQIRHCYETLLQSDPGANGALRLLFKISSTGNISSVSMKSDTIGNSNLAGCVSGKIVRWKFPTPLGEAYADVDQKFTFKTP